MRENGLKYIGTLASGEPVYDRYNSHLHSDVSQLLPEVFEGVSGMGRFMEIEHNFGRFVGNASCVATDRNDEVVYAQRPKRAGLSRFVKNRCSEPCDSAVVVLLRDDVEPYYVLITAFIGRKSGPEPWDRRATAHDREFWSRHALIYGSEPIIPGTETAVCPW